MRQMRWFLLGAMGIVGCMGVLTAHTNKTYLQPRSEVVNVPWWHTTFDDLTYKTTPEERWGHNLEVSSLYQESFDGCKAGRYFLVSEKNPISLQSTRADEGHETDKGTAQDVDATYILASAGFTDEDAHIFNAADFKLGLRPRERVVGVGLMCHYNLYKLLKNLYVYAQVPVTAVERDQRYSLSATLDDSVSRTIYYDALREYFLGDRETPVVRLVDPSNSRGQVKLEKGKLAEYPLGSIGFSDIDAGIGYAFLNKPKYYAALALGVTFPAGNSTHGGYVFEPVRGNGGFWGFGGNADAWVNLYTSSKHILKLMFDGELRYLFKESRTRTLGLKGRPWGQYFLLGKQDQALLIPAANVLTLDVDVTPGWQFDGTLGFAYHHRRFCAELGYNLYAHEGEKVSLASFPDNTYAVAARGHSTAWEDVPDHWAPLPFDVTVANMVDGGVPADAMVNMSSIDTHVAETPSQFTNAIYGSLGYRYDDPKNDYATMWSIGAKAEWASTNSALSQWSAWMKIGLSY